MAQYSLYCAVRGETIRGKGHVFSLLHLLLHSALAI